MAPDGRRADPFLFLPGSTGIRRGWAGVELRSPGVPQAACSVGGWGSQVVRPVTLAPQVYLVVELRSGRVLSRFSCSEEQKGR